jgi:hypothetical protein
MIYKNYLLDLLEAQRYFTQSGLDRLKKYAGDPDVFISYRSINKLGINPNNEYNTPHAIYAYPLNEFLDKMRSSMDVPFAGNEPYIYVFRIKPEYRSRFIADAYKYSSADFDRDYAKLKRFAESLTLPPYISPNTHGDPDEVDEDEEKINRENYESTFDLDTYLGFKGTPRIKNPFGYLWFYIRELSAQASRRSVEYKNTNPTMIWNMILRKVLGYCGVCDRGQGIIHPSEPTQAIFLSKDCIEEIEVVRNITDQSTVADVRASFGGLSRSKKDPYGKIKFRNDKIIVLDFSTFNIPKVIVKRISDNSVIAEIRGEFKERLTMDFDDKTLLFIEHLNNREVTVIDESGNIVKEFKLNDIRRLVTMDYPGFFVFQIQYAVSNKFDLFKVVNGNFELILTGLIDVETNQQLKHKKYLIVDVGTDRNDSYPGVYDLANDKYIIEPHPEYSYIEASEFLNHETRWDVHLKNSQGIKRIVTKG